VTIETEFVGGVAGVETLARLNTFVQNIVTKRLDFHANRMLDEHLAKVGDVNYLMEVDGVNAPDRRSFATARRRITIRFTDALIRLAAGRFADILRNAISTEGARGPKGSWINKPEMVASVKVLYGKKGEKLRFVSDSEEIPQFGPGDIVMLVPIYDAQMFANAKKFGATGIMAKASAEIRKIVLGTVSSRSAARKSQLRVFAQRSSAVFAKLATSNQGESHRTTDGSVIRMTLPRPNMNSSWVIIIRYKEKA
jgi:hypothetical protein